LWEGYSGSKVFKEDNSSVVKLSDAILLPSLAFLTELKDFKSLRQICKRFLAMRLPRNLFTSAKMRKYPFTLELFTHDSKCRDAAQALILALSKRPLLLSKTRGGHHFTTWNRKSAIHKAKRAEEKFYEIFRDRCRKLHVHLRSSDYRVCVQAVVNGLKKLSESKAVSKEDAVALQLKVKTTLGNFCQKSYDNMLEDFASQPAASITIKGYRQKAQDLREFCVQRFLGSQSLPKVS
jgi:hypothetical protein